MQQKNLEYNFFKAFLNSNKGQKDQPKVLRHLRHLSYVLSCQTQTFQKVVLVFKFQNLTLILKLLYVWSYKTENI